MTERGPLLIVASGLAFEAGIARGAGVHACSGPGERLLGALAGAPVERCTGVLSFGIAAGLDPALRPGALVVASQVKDEAGRHAATDAEWRSALLSRLAHASGGSVLGLAAPVAGVAEKSRLFARTAAVAADMESHLAARFAERHGLRFAALRVVSDPADQAVPPVALQGLRPDGSTDPSAVLYALLRTPSSLGPLLRIALGTAVARRALARARRRLGPGFGLVDLA